MTVFVYTFCDKGRDMVMLKTCSYSVHDFGTVYPSSNILFKCKKESWIDFLKYGTWYFWLRQNITFIIVKRPNWYLWLSILVAHIPNGIAQRILFFDSCMVLHARNIRLYTMWMINVFKKDWRNYYYVIREIY